MMQVGKLRQRIVIQRKSSNVFDSGEVTFTWNAFATAWADIRTPRGEEFFAHEKFTGIATHKVITRWIQTLTPDMRVSWTIDGATRILNILYSEEDRFHKKMRVLWCKEVAA